MLANVLRKSYFMKVVSVVLTLTFLSMNSAFAIPDNSISSPVEKVLEKEVAVDDIGIAIDSGTIKSKYDGGNNKVIIHIQDAHCNYEAQSNINKILDQVTKECGIKMISVEGAEGIVDTAWFRAFPDAEIRKEVANYFMKKGEITGAEFFSINSDYDGTIFGAETRDYYIKNLKAFTEVYPYKDSIEKYLKNLETIANRLKTVVYTPELKELDLNIRKFDSKDLELSDFASYLAQAAAKNKVDIKGYKDFKKLLQTLEYEKKIDFDIVDAERSDYIEALSKKLSKEDMANLVAKSIKFKKGHIKSVDFYTYLRKQAKEQDIDIIHEYPNLFYYYIYTKLYEGINNETLFKDLDKIQTALKEKLYKNDTQRRLDKYSEMVVMFVNLVNIELTNDDYDTFKKYRKEFSLEDVLDFFSSLSDRYGLGYSIDTLPGQISDNLPNMVNFYEIAKKRDKALIDNTLQRMEKEGKDRCVLIAGGFHTRGIKDLLKKQGVSYVVVTPKITKDVETPYIKVLTNQRTSLEDIITESAAMPGTTVSNSREGMVTTAKGKMLAPLAKVFYTIHLLLEDETALESMSKEIGELEFDYNGGMIKTTLLDAVTTGYEDMVSKLIVDWLKKQSPEENDAVSQESWDKLVENWKSLSGAFQMKMNKLSDDKLNDRIIKTVITTFNDIFAEPGTGSTGSNAVRLVAEFDAYEKMSLEQTIGMDRTIAALMKDKSYEEIFSKTVDIVDPETGELGEIEIVPLVGWREKIEAENINTGARIPMDVMVHPGTGKKKYKRLYIDAAMLAALDDEQIQRLANHEFRHILDPDKTEEQVMEELNDDLADVRSALAKVEADRINKKAQSNKNLLKHSKAMSEAAKNGVGPELAIIVATSQAEADFWQNRLTGDDNETGSGTVVKKGAQVLAITEANWKGGAGNGLGTLNGFVQAARLAASRNLLGTVKSTDDIETLVKAFMDYCNGKTTFMYHTAGKGTRTAPIPGSEINSKPSIKLPKTIVVDGEIVPLTILEAVLMQTSTYADSRKNRMGVFWGDQIIVNEKDVSFKGRKHNVEIFGQMVPLDEGIKAYGVLLPQEQGDCWQREKLPLEEVKKLLPPGQTSAYKSIGSFTVSLPFLNALINLEMDALKNAGKKKIDTITGKEIVVPDKRTSLDTDPDFWQPLTSKRKTYVKMMKDKKMKKLKAEKGLTKKDIDEEVKAAVVVAGAQWDRINNMWKQFKEDPAVKDSGLDRKIGYTDVGENSFWWDYGQNKLFLANMQLLTQASPEAKAARIFFNVEKPAQQDETVIVKNYRDAKAAEWAWSNKSKEVKRVLIEKMAEEQAVSVGNLRTEDFYEPIKSFGGKNLSGLLLWAKNDYNVETEEIALKKLLSFVGIDPRGWISDDSIVLDGVNVTNSVIKNSTIKSGYLKNSVVINSTLSHVEAEDAIIIGSTVISLKAFGGVIYNVVQAKASVQAGQILANIYRPGIGRVEMRTKITRDGEWDFKKGPDGKTGAWVFDNLYKYAEIHKNNRGVSIEDVNELKEKEIEKVLGLEKEILASTQPDTYAERAQRLVDRRNEQAQIAAKAKNVEVLDKDLITISEARKTIAQRLLVFGDVDYFTAESYAEAFNVTKEEAGQELEDLASMAQEAVPAKGEKELLPGIQRIRNIVFSEEKADYVEVGGPIYAAVPQENREEYIENMRVMAFGTSGLRATVDVMTDIEVYLNTRGYIKFLNSEANLSDGDTISIVGDLRPSSERLMKTIGQAVEDEAKNLGKELFLDFGGKTSSPAGAFRGITKNSFAIVVTGSHIPFDMNGIKYYMKDGEEVLKAHEKPILAAVKEARAEEKLKDWKESSFDDKGMFKVEPDYNVRENEEEVKQQYIDRYINNFRKNMLKGMNIVFWKHSAVGADDVDIVLNDLGAKTVTMEQDKKTFVPVDTEKVKPAMAEKLASLSKGFTDNNDGKKPDAVIFTDGDSDRPGVADENGQFLTGDKLGLLATKYLAQAIPKGEQLVVALPISTNFGVVDELESMGVKVIKTKIGSPHVVKAMNDAQALAAREGKKIHTLGWEANGGFLLGSEFKIPEGGSLTRLATRDAMFPILAVLAFAKSTNRSLSQLFAEELRPVANHTGGYESFNKDFGIDRDTAMEVRKGVVNMLKPNLSNTDVVAIDYDTMTLQKNVTAEINGEQVLTFERETILPSEVSAEDMAEWMRVKTLLESVFTPERGFEDRRIVGVDIMDGIQVIFDKDGKKEISHIRPSGNDPVFRNYAMSEVFDSVEENMERAKQMASVGETDIIKSLAETSLNNLRETPGRQAVRTQLSKATPLGKIVQAILDGKQPIYIKPYLEEKESWGKELDGRMIGEFWFGAEKGDQSSTVVVGDMEASMAEVMKYASEAVVGEGALRNFGEMLPLTKILTPRSRLSMQFHDKKNELWVVTGIDKSLAGANPSIALGFSQQAVDKYGENVNSEYGKVAKVFGDKLNALRIHLEDIAMDKLEETQDIMKASESLTDTKTKQLVAELNEAKDDIEFFYNYLEVKMGDVIPIPAGTLHALGAGIEVLEPQIAGETQSLEDGFTWRIRYAFPGYETESTKKTLDIDRVNEMIPDVVKLALPEVVEETDTYTIEKLPGNFDDKGLVVNRLNMTKGAQIEVTDNDSMHFLAIVSETGSAKIEIDGKLFDLPKAKVGENLPLIPATVKNYKIIALEDVQIVDTSMPNIKTSEVVLPNDAEQIADTNEKPYSEKVVLDSFGSTINAFDQITIIDEADKLPIIGNREHTITVLAGAIKVVKQNGEEINVKTYDEITLAGDEEYKIVSTGDVNAVVQLNYTKDDNEKTAYAVYEIVKKYIPAMKGKKFDLIFAKEFFADGDGVGSKVWFEKEINKLLGWQPGDKEEIVKIKTYNNDLGLQEAVKVRTRPEAIAVLGVTNIKIQEAEKDKNMQEYLQKAKNVRIMSLPDIVAGDPNKTNPGEYALTREIALTGLMQAILTKEEIEEPTTGLAIDMVRIMAQMTGKRDLTRQDLYYLLPYAEASQAVEDMGLLTEDEVFTVSMFLNRLLGLTLKAIKPYDARKELEMRKKVMYSA